MRARWWVLSVLIVAMVLAIAHAGPAQAQARKRTIKVVMTSFKFEPSMIPLTRGETIVLQLVNEDRDNRNHSISSRFFISVPATLRGDLFREGTEEDRKFYAVAPGKQIELEFVAQNSGSFPFICLIGTHSDRGMFGAFNVKTGTQ